jgi:hypothetical protein
LDYKAEKAIIEKKAIQLYVMERMSGEKVGKELGISSTEVFRILERHNIRRRQRKSVAAQRINEMYKNEISIGDISKHFGLHDRTVEIILSQLKLPIHN